jgi:acyl-CoA dehydrogenase
VIINRRHDPLRVPFYNSPTQGKNVVVPIDAIVGGAAQAGNGWRMLMECLAAGRGISLPAQATGGAKYASRVASAHAVVRKQFSVSIGKFEGIEEPLARIAGFTYLLESMRRAICGAIDRGVRPPIATAIAKYHSTELGRKIINDAMDIAGGIGITMGPRNLLAHGYIAAPIAVTVEGANILTRTLMIFGQGAIRAHPYALREMQAAAENDLESFDGALWGHAAALIRNTIRSIGLGLSRGRLVFAPKPGPTARYWQKLSWASSNFSLLTDLHLIGLGGRLKKMEATGGRFADVLSWLVIVSSVLRRFEADGAPEEDLPLMKWCADYSFARIQDAFDGLYLNSRLPGLAGFLRTFIYKYSRLNSMGADAPDSISFKIAKGIQTPGALRNVRLTGGIFIPEDENDPFVRLEHAFRLVHQSEPIRSQVKAGVKISAFEEELLARAEAARESAIQVDDFSFEEYLGRAKKRRAA